ncbi:MAG: translocation/assembly module TamB domain-containing protein [Terriglobales bacterium]
MSETAAKPGRRSIWKYLLWLSVLGVLVVLAVGWYSTTDSFRRLVRERLIATLGRITGGRVELASLHAVPFHFQVEVRNLTIHGREGPGEIPYAHVDSLMAQVKIWSLLRSELGLNYVVLDHPVVHIILYSDGTTNQPEPRVKQVSQTKTMEQIFALSVGRFEVRRGELIWGDQRMALDFALRDVSADMSYSFLRSRYEGNLLLGKADTAFGGYRPFAWTAEAHFSLERNQVEVRSLKATSGRSRLQAAGQVVNFSQPKVDGDYDVSLDLAEAAALTRRPEVRRGTLQLKGHGSWSAQDFSSLGRVLISNLDWRDAPVGVHNASLTAQYAVDPVRLALSQIQGHVLGGSVAGDAEVTHWLNAQTLIVPAKEKKKERENDQQTGAVRLRFVDLSAAEIAAAVSTPSRPFERIRPAGRASGSVQARWKDAVRNTEAEFVADVAPPPVASKAQFPLTAHAQGVYRFGSGELQLAELTAATRATQVHASGTLSSAAALKLAVATTDLGEWEPVFSAAGYSGQIPVTLKGHASFSGTATGKLSQIAIAGNLQSQDFETLIPATSHTPERWINWNALRADVQLSPSVFAVRNGILSRDPDSLKFDFRLQLDHRQFNEGSAFEAHLDSQNADLPGILALAGYAYPVTGTADLHLQLSGTRAAPVGQGSVLLRNGSIYGEPVERFSSELHFNGDEVEFTKIQLTHYEASVAGNAAFNPSSQAFRFSLTGNNFDLTRISTLQSARIAVKGRADFTAEGSGTMDAPRLNAAIHLHDLTFDQERAGDFTINAVSQGADLRITGQSQFEQAELKVDGNAHLREDWPADVYFRFHQLDLDSVFQTYLRGAVSGHSRADGEVHMVGPLRRPRELQFTANLDNLDADVEDVKIKNQGPVRFAVADQSLQIDQFHLVGEDTDISASGKVHLTGERELDLRAQGQVNLKLIESFNPDFTSSGVVSVDLSVAGTFGKPVMQGRVRVESGAIAYIDLPSALSGINGSLIFNQDRLQIESLTAHTGGGLVTFGGYATAYNGKFNFDLTVRGDEVRLRYPPGVSATANADLHFVGSSSGSMLNGEIVVGKLAMTPGFDFGAYLERSQSSALPPTNRLLNRIRLDVHITTTPELQMQTASLRLSGDADLHLRGTAGKPVILGRADIIEGEVQFNGTKYRLERGDITFINPVTTTPVLDLQAATRVRDYDITLNLNGPVDRPNVTYRSEPPLPTSDIIGLLAFGQTSEESAQLNQSQSAFNSETSSAILSAALNATVSNRVQKLFGVSRIKIDPQGLNTETSSTQTGPAVTIEQQVKNNLTLTYTTNVAQASQQIIQAEYNITRSVSIVAVRDQNGVVSIDVRVRQRKK